MDAEIIYDNGERFKLSDLSVEVTDFKVSSMVKQSVYEDIEGANRVDYGAEYKHRTISIPFIMTAYDLHDFAHLRNEIFAKVDSLESFYIREMRRPIRRQYEFVDFNEKPKEREGADDQYVDGKQYRVRLADVIEIEQRGVKGVGELVFETTESPYAQSVYTTLELHDTGYSATAEKYGLADSIDDEKVKYRFGPTLDTTNLTSDLFEQGNIHNSQGFDLDVAIEYARTKDFHSVIKGNRYKLKLSESSGNANFVRIFHYNSDGSFIGNDAGMSNVNGNGTSEYTFTALGERLRLVVYPYGSNQVLVSDIGTTTQISLSSYSTASTFTVYNAGNVPILYPQIELTGVTGSNFTISNVTTGETVQINKTLNNRTIGIGLLITDNGLNIFRDTNRKSIRLAPGDNQFEVTGTTFEEVSFDFKFKYK